MTYIGWFDPDKKTAIRIKFAEASARYAERHGVAPTHAMVSPHDAESLGDMPDIEITAHAYIPVNTIYVGRGDAP